MRSAKVGCPLDGTDLTAERRAAVAHAQQADNPDQVPERLDKSVAVQAEHEISALVGRSRVAAHLWYFMNASTVNLIQRHLGQQESQPDSISLDAIIRGDS